MAYQRVVETENLLKIFRPSKGALTLMQTKLASVTQEPRYRTRIDALMALWNLEESPRLCWVLDASPAALPLLAEGFPFAEFFQNQGLQLEQELKALEWVEQLEIDDLYVPHIQPQAGVTIFASAFGCVIDYPEDTYPQSHPIIKSGDPAEKVYDLPRPSVAEGQLGQMLAFTDYFVEQTGGRYPIQMTDIQSPVDTSLLIWDPTSFLMAMFDHPKEVHHLMRLVTDLTIDFIKEHRARSPEFVPLHYPAAWFPDGMGVAISDDALAVLSPQTYEEFALPYTNELSEEFGGIFIHSCGNLTHQFDVLKKVHQLRGINFGATETPFEAVWENFNGKTAIVPHMGLNKDIHFETQLDYVQHILWTKTHNRGLLLMVSPSKICGNQLNTAIIRQFSDTISALINEDAQHHI